MPSQGYRESRKNASPRNSAADVAVWAARRGWTVVKTIPGTKKAAEKWRELDWRDPETVRQIWSRGRYGVGIATGPSKLVDDDLDVDDEGNPAGEWDLENLADGDWGKLPATFELATPSGGRQLIWQAPRGREFKSISDREGEKGIVGAPYIDIRGRGGLFVLWDPTQPGRFVTDDRDPVEMPAWLAELHPEPGASVNGQGQAADIPDARKWLEGYGGGDPCKVIAGTRDKWLSELKSGTPHDVMRDAVYALIGDSVAGHPGLNSVLRELRDAFYAAMAGKTREREKVADWRNCIASAVAHKVGKLGEPSTAHPCAELAELNDVSPRRRGLIQWLSDRESKLIKWLWPGYLPLGCVVMLDGESGHGKTLTLYDVAARASRGWPMPDGTQSISGPVNVLVLAPEEMVDSIIVPRLMAAGADLSRIAIPRIQAKSGKAHEMFLLPDSARKIADMVREASASLLIIDPITSFLAPTVNSGNDASVRYALAPLAAELGETQCCAPMVRHFNKNLMMAAKYRGGGLVAFAAIARVHLIAARLPDGHDGLGHFGISQVDTNLTKRIDGTLAYSIVDSDIPLDDEGNMVPCVEWHGIVDIDADTLTKGERKRPGPESLVQDEIIEVLERMFDEQDTWKVEDAQTELKRAGVTANKETIAKARNKVGAVARQTFRPEGGIAGWVWTTKPEKLRARTSARGLRESIVSTGSMPTKNTKRE